MTTTGYVRKYALWLLNHAEEVLAPPADLRRRYEPEVEEALVLAWKTLNRIATKRLIPFLPDLLETLGEQGHVQLSQEHRLQPDLAWVLETVQPASTQNTQTFDPAPYRQQIQAALIAADMHYRDRRYREEMRQTLATIQIIAADYNQRQESDAALAIYEVLLGEVIKRYSQPDADYEAFTVVLYHLH